MKVPIWWLMLSIMLLALMAMGMDGERNFRNYALTERAELIPSKFEDLAASYQKGAPFGLESTLYFYAGTLMLLGIPTVIGAVAYGIRKKNRQVAGLAVGFVVFMILQLSMEYLFAIRKEAVTAGELETRREDMIRQSQISRELDHPSKTEKRKYPRALPGGGLDWTGVEGGPR